MEVGLSAEVSDATSSPRMRGIYTFASFSFLQRKHLLIARLATKVNRLCTVFPSEVSSCPLSFIFRIPSSMAENKSTAQRRLSQVKDFLTMNKTAATIPFNPDSSKFPLRKDVPQAPYAPPGVPTAWVWGETDFIGRLNLLTPTRVKTAAASEIKTGEMVSLK